MNYTLMQLKESSTPEEFSRQLREMGDIFWWEAGKFWVITSYQLAKNILMSKDFTCDRSPFFISRMPEMNLDLIADFFVTTLACKCNRCAFPMTAFRVVLPIIKAIWLAV